MPQNTIALTQANPGSSTNINTATSTQVKTGSGTLLSVVVNTGGASSTLTLYDGTSTSGKKLATMATATSAVSLPYNLKFSTGLFAVTANGTAADITVVYL